MIKQIKIENFKSVQHLELDLGRINVFIGENGCGKTNILEAIATGSAAVENKFDNEFLNTRGVRLTDPEYTVSAFTLPEEPDAINEIKIKFVDDQNQYLKTFIHFMENKWQATFSVDDAWGLQVGIGLFDMEANLLYTGDEASKANEKFFRVRRSMLSNSHIAPFLIFSPENSKLRQFQMEGQILPLGISGEGLFRHIVELSKKSPELFEKIKKHLEIIDWFEDMEIPKDLMFTERRMNIKDRFLHPSLQFFDQRSTNEGFLYLLFYYTLFISKSTPGFFAIDNIDNALNPKLCSKLIETLAILAKEHDKQVIVTTHNPVILDGLDLSDEEQRLFVIYRNADGHTVAKRVQKKTQVNGTESVRLSEAFIRGYLGGLPKNF